MTRFRLYGRRHRPSSRGYFILLLIIIASVAVFMIKKRQKDLVVEDAEGQGNVAVTNDLATGSVPEVQSQAQTDVPAEPVVSAEPQVNTEPVSQAPVTEVSGQLDEQARALIAEALEDIKADKVIAARDKLNQSLGMSLSSEVRKTVKAQMAQLAERWLFSRDHFSGDTLTALYEIRPGDTLGRIADAHKTPHEIIGKINRIARPESIQAGQKIKVIEGPFRAIVCRPAFTMDLYLQNTYVKTYRVGLGRQGKDTPTGRWIVKQGGKLIEPVWTDPDTGKTYIPGAPDYPLGSRWIALDGLEGNAKGRTGFAIHGTKDPETIGTRSSKGCIRLFNGDVIEVYDLMAPLFSEVQVTD